MKFNRKNIIVILWLFILTSQSHAALQNVGKTVGRIDITKNIAIIWVNGELQGRSNNCNTIPAISCPIGEKYCDMILSTALAAKMSNRKVEFTYSNQCNSSFADVARFRMMD